MILYLIIGFILGGLLFSIIVKQIDKNRYVVQQKKVDDSVKQELNALVQQKQELLKQKEEELNALDQQINELSKEKEEELKNLTFLTQKKDLSKQEIESLQRVKENTLVDIDLMKNQAEKTANAFYDEKMKTAKERFGFQLEKLAIDYQDKQEQYENDYSEMLNDFAKQFKDKVEAEQEEFATLKVYREELLDKIERLKKQISVAVEASKRAELERNEKNFYRLILTPNDQLDVKRLKEVEPLLVNKEVLAKLIWKTYYERAYTEMCNRVLGQGTKMGIYKITNLENNMPYVGQSVNIRERWREHIKAGLGINSSNNRLYTAMKQFGPENFTFELLEECERSELNQKEKYWIDFFHTEDFGLNSNKGVQK